MEQFKDAYEISLWEDVPVAASGSENNKIPAHYEEEKIGVIGSDTMTAQWRAVEPRLIQNVNGTNTFSFKMFYTYIDTITGERKDNPFKTLLVNERKVKVKWKGDWYDFVIKNINEDSSGESVTYTCQDQFINELSKNGFNLEFDNELGNNMGTAQELAKTVLDGTDWTVGLGKPIKQYREEPVYDISDTWIDEQQVRHNIRFLVFYSVVQNHATDFQYWYDSSNQYTRDGTSMLVVNGECKSTIASWSEDTATVTIEEHSMEIDFAPLNVSDNYRAKRLVKSQEAAFCPPLDRYVLKYKKDDDTYYGYETTSYTDPTLVTDYIVNGRAFTSTQGWKNLTSATDNDPKVYFNVYPPYSTGAENVTSYLIIPKGDWIQNSTLYDYRYGRFKNGLTKGEKLVLRVKAKYGNDTAPDSYFTGGINDIRVSSTNDGGTNYINVESTIVETDELGNYTGWVRYILKVTSSCAYNNLISNTPVTLRFKYSNQTSSITRLWIEEIQFFDYITDASGKLLIPSEYDVDGVVKTEWRYFAEQYLTVPSEEDIVFSDYSDTPDLNYIPDYPEGNKVGEKIRSITGKNSNRFNWIQTIAETFECWAKFYIEHNPETGELRYYNGVPHKEVTFVEEIGDNIGLSFVYGIDLNTISRTINSDQIATKVIVSPNSNEFGQDGFCTIARSSENYSKTNFILDFGYYINQGMLNSGEINRDLYDSSNSGNGIGYYYWLRQLNTEYDQITDDIVDLKAQLDRYNSALDNYTKLCDSTTKEINSVQTRLMGYAGLTGTFNKTKVYNYVKNHGDYQAVQTLWDTLTRLNTELPKYQETKSQINTQVTKLNNDIETKEASQKTIEGNIKKLDEKFYKKYARFIQEGSWISEDYYDDNLYYLDAESVAYTSSRPQIQYNINVLRLSALDEFKNKIFNVGDRGYVEDTEFFGYAKDANGNITNTPYKEEILISEITSVFDSPEQDTITVQNYKTQFEDLFQRITATTQSLQYASGAYNRAASIVEPTGEINSWTLEKSFAYNEQLAWRATDDSVVINSTGITAVDTTNPQNMVRLSSAGLQISDNGGVTWTVGVSGAGISTQNLTAGSINVDNIQILSGTYPTFTWNKYGLSAYRFDTDSNGTISNVQSGNFVRHDQYGIYGVNNINDSDWKPYAVKGETPLEYIRENAAFGMTWDGFFMRNKGYNYDDLNALNQEYYYQENNNYIKLNLNEAFQFNVQYYTKDINEEQGIENYSEAFILNPSKVYYIRDFKYITTKDNEPQENKTYYTKENNEYIEFEGQTFDSSLTYYERVEGEEFIQYSNDNIFSQDQTYYEKIFSNGYTEISSDGDIIVYDGQYNRIKIGNLGTIGDPKYGIQIKNGVGQDVMVTADDGSLWLKDRLNIGNENSNYRIGIGNLGAAEGEILSQVFNANDNFIVYEDGSIKATNGKFSGDITGSTGIFSGTITAEDGNIGGFAIGKDTLISENNNLILQSQNYPDTYIQTFDTVYDVKKVYYINGNGTKFIPSFEEGFTYYELVDEYIETEDETPVIGKVYYILKDDEYIEYIGSEEPFEDEVTYYEKTTEYIETSDNIYNTNKIYYIKENNEYIEFIPSFNSGVIYYEKSGQTINANNNFIVYENGTIVVQNGIFSGEVNATSGTFAGDISAASGTLGGFKIESNKLISTNDIENPSIELNGTDGSIIANNIHLGTGAIIDQYIELGSAKIQNPEIEGNNRVFITTDDSALQIRDDGIANFGDITISGPQSIILGDNFAIRPGLSEFNNVNIKGTLQTSVFEVGTVQTVGGMMIFKEGAEIDGEITPLENNQYTFKTKEGSVTSIKEGSIILLTNKDDNFIRQYATVKSINENNKIQTYTVEASNDITSYTNITQISDLGDYEYFITSDIEKDNNKTYYINENNEYVEFTGESFEENVEYYERTETKKLKNNLLIGVNSNSSDQWQLLRQSFTMRQFEGLKSNIPENDESGDYGDWSEPLLVLGDLSSIANIKQESKIEGFGLYGENVYLTGSLTTEVAQNSYAGVNTLSKVMSTKSGNNNERIVFWAGASANTGEAIQASPFQVTEKGSIYANSGLFEGAILTKASISASKIYTAHLYGWDTTTTSEDATAPLTIHAKYDGAPGIDFINDSNKYKIEYIYIETTDTEKDNNKTYYIKNNDEYIEFTGESFEEGIEYYEQEEKKVEQEENPPILSINNAGLIFKKEQFVNLEGSTAKFIGEFETKKDLNGSIKLNIAQTTISSISDDDNNTLYGSLVFGNTQNKLSIGDSNITQTNSNLGFNVPTTTISDELIIGTRLDYQKVNDGYDLYVS